MTSKFENAAFSHAVALRAALIRKLQDAVEEAAECAASKDGVSAIARLLRERAVVLGGQNINCHALPGCARVVFIKRGQLPEYHVRYLAAKWTS